ncbi:MAG TPA: 50S ribosomal protein L10 [Bacteroidetes bacterium]|nr:50S ribosomal protein L10 [bacterium BMS3Bbin04]HDO66123.1 50S ribosomal protein L10 [Bacteroidota bacterium]HEX05248.1 50S ribosomal protein L10 [Bacteroidota bacterium]
MGDFTAKASPLKKEALKALQSRLEGIESMIFADYRGLNVKEMNELRSDFHKTGCSEFIVVKNSILKMALESRGIEITDDSLLKGPVGIGIGEDPVTPAKTLGDFAKKHKSLEFKGVLVDGEFYDAEKVKIFAEMPSQQELYAGIVGSIASPLSGLVIVLNEIVREFLSVLEAVIQEKQKQEDGAAA